MSQLDEFMKQAEAVGAKEEKVLVVTGKPGSGKPGLGLCGCPSADYRRISTASA